MLIIVSLYVGLVVFCLTVLIEAAKKRRTTVGYENQKYTNVVRVTRVRLTWILFVGTAAMVGYLSYVGILF